MKQCFHTATQGFRLTTFSIFCAGTIIVIKLWVFNCVRYILIFYSTTHPKKL